MDGTQEYDGGITVELKDTQEFGESKITKRIFDVSMEQVMVANYACAIAAPNADPDFALRARMRISATFRYSMSVTLSSPG